MLIKKNFYNQDTIKVAKRLLGCYLVRKYRGKIIRAKIIETEAYQGENDLASHASKGKTERNKAMFGEPGRAYIYLIYGMYYMFNIVTEKKNFPAAVLIRGLSNDYQIKTKNQKKRIKKLKKLDGPGKLTKNLVIGKSFNGWDLTKGEKIWLEYPVLQNQNNIKVKASPRIGVDYAKDSKDWLWNFKIEE